MATAIKNKRKPKPRSARKLERPKPVKQKNQPSPQGRVLHKKYGLTRRTVSRMTGLSDRTLATWESGKDIGEVGRRSIVATERLLNELARVIEKDAIPGWLERPNAAFDSLKPLELMERGQADRLWRMIYLVGSGIAS